MSDQSQPIYLSEVRPNRFAESDLRWYFQESEGAMGLKSNFMPMVNKMQFKTILQSTYSYNPSSSHLDTRGAERARPIKRALDQLTREHFAILRDRFGHLPDVVRGWEGATPNTAAEFELAFRTEAGVMVTAAKNAHRRSRTTRPVVEWLLRLHSRAKKGDVEARAQEKEISRHAGVLVLQAISVYAAAKKRRRAG